MERLTEWIEENGERQAHLRKDVFVPMTDVFGRLAEYEDIDTVDEVKHKADICKRMEAYLDRLQKIVERREDDLK